MEPEKKRVSGRVWVEPTRPELDPKIRKFQKYFNQNIFKKPENIGFSG